MEHLAQALKHAAMHHTSDEKKVKYLAERPDYKDVIRVQDLDILQCWYGFIFTRNCSPYTLEEDMTPRLEGFEVVYPVVEL